MTGPPSDVLRVDIGPRNEAALRETCQRLANIVIDSRRADERWQATRQLAYISDPLAVPTFKMVLDATNFADSAMIEALRKVGTPEAMRVLDEMSKSDKEERAALARNAVQRLKSQVPPK